MNVKTLKALLLVEFFLVIQNGLLGQTNSEPKRYDIVFSEIMSKPTPQIGLPAVEYIELHNRLPYPCKLQKWRLTLGNTAKNLPDITIDSCGYVVLAAQKYEETFAPYCDHLYTLSSLAITDGGQSLTLYNQNGEMIHYVSFKPSWHSEKIKQEGGWSLEMIDEGWPCAGSWNWNSSSDPLGGTPGRPNSIRNVLYDNELPRLAGVTLLDSMTLRVHISKTVLEPPSHDDVAFITKPYLNIVEVSEVPPEFNAFDLYFGETVQPMVKYVLHFSGEVSDCGGNVYRMEEEIPFGIAIPPTSNDLVINEILTNPLGDENADYLELYNRSDHIIDLKEVKIGYDGDTLPQKAIVAFSRGWQLHPKSYVALCKQRAVTIQQYVCKDESRLLECDSLPNFAIESGIVHVTDRSLRPIDRLAYSEAWHYSKLLSTKGVSLERLRVDAPTQDENNWRSAAESAGFGTPGYENSQVGTLMETTDIEVFPEVFSPDNDGFEDFAEVVCTFEDGECLVSIVVYNNRGHPVKHLANNVLCGETAHFRWDGDDDNSQPAPAGMYVVQVESWNLRTKKTLRKRKIVSIYRL